MNSYQLIDLQTLKCILCAVSQNASVNQMHILPCEYLKAYEMLKENFIHILNLYFRYLSDSLHTHTHPPYCNLIKWSLFSPCNVTGEYSSHRVLMLLFSLLDMRFYIIGLVSEDIFKPPVYLVKALLKQIIYSIKTLGQVHSHCQT